MQDVMTSSTHYGTNKSAYDYMVQISDALSAYGFNVVRNKIETIPWHPAAPRELGDPMPTDCYFESHLAIVCNEERHEQLSALASEWNAHLSRNMYKQLDDGNYIIMMTLRDYNNNYDTFKRNVDLLKNELISLSFTVEKTIVEFALYDSNIHHDASWLIK
jgi:hypothetical protein